MMSKSLLMVGEYLKFMSFFFLTLLIVKMFTSNMSPMKYCMMTTFYILVSCYYIWEKTDSSWVSLILMMLFMGGIMMIYTVMCSTSPNLLFKNKKMSLVTMMLTTSISTLYLASTEPSQIYNVMKESGMSISIILILSLAMSFYLLMMTLMLSKEKLSIRSYA